MDNLSLQNSCTPVLSLILITWLLLISTAQAEEIHNQESDSFTVGVVIPLSGPVASMGDYVRKGVDLAYSELPASEQKRIKVIYEDDQFDTKQTVSAFRRLGGCSGLDAVFVIGSPPANALSPLVENQQCLLFAIGASDPSIALNKLFSFIHWVTPETLGDLLAKELIRRDFKKIAFVTAEISGALADRDGAISALKDYGESGRIVFDESYPGGQTDYRTTLLKLQQREADAVVVALFPGALSSFAKQFRDNRIEAELIGMETFEDESEIKAAQGALDGAWYVNAADPTDDFIARYKAKYQQHPGWASGNGYDAMMLTVAAFRSAGKDSRQAAQYLADIKDYSGASGRYSASGDNRFSVPAALKIVSGEGFKRLE